MSTKTIKMDEYSQFAKCKIETTKACTVVRGYDRNGKETSYHVGKDAYSIQNLERWLWEDMSPYWADKVLEVVREAR